MFGYVGVCVLYFRKSHFLSVYHEFVQNMCVYVWCVPVFKLFAEFLFENAVPNVYMIKIQLKCFINFCIIIIFKQKSVLIKISYFDILWIKIFKHQMEFSLMLKCYLYNNCSIILLPSILFLKRPYSSYIKEITCQTKKPRISTYPQHQPWRFLLHTCFNCL